MSKSSVSSKQQGAALVVALLVVSIVVIMATAVGGDFQLLFRKVENQLLSQQAQHYLMGAEGIARKGLLDDLNTASSAGKDYRQESWGTPLTLPIDEGVIRGCVVDLQGRLNLNDLARTKSGSPPAYTVDQQRFIRLLQTLDLDPPLTEPEARGITDAVIDWLDADKNERYPDGAEDLYYSETEPPGRSANRAMADMSELRFVKGVSAEIFRALESDVTVWPAGGGRLNINTASAQLLRSLNSDKNLQPLDSVLVEEILKERKDNYGVDTLGIFEKGGLLASSTIDTANLGVASDYFLLRTDIEFLGRYFQSRSVIYRDKTKKEVKVIARNQSNLSRDMETFCDNTIN